MSLFDLVAKRPNEKFELIRTKPMNQVTRRMMSVVFRTYSDTDGNFVEQVQSTGFDARVLELYLHATFSDLGFSLERPAAPDFIIERGDLRIAVEATTSNPSTSGALMKFGSRLGELGRDERSEYLRNEWAIRLGGPLTTKLKKQYWLQNNCAGLPFVIVIEAFHDPSAIFLSHTMVGAYLHGFQIVNPMVRDGQMKFDVGPLDGHTLGSKTIPSGFFSLPEAENVSAVIFTNAATTGKFTRMGWPAHGDPSVVAVARTGAMWNPDPDVRYPTWFAYDLRKPPAKERWTDGMVVFHNPRARVPLPSQAFDGVTQIFSPVDEQYVERHVFSSNTILLNSLPAAFEPIEVSCIPRAEGHAVAGVPLPSIVTADHWFSDKKKEFLGVITQDTEEPGEWRAWTLVRAPDGKHYPVEGGSKLFSYDQEAADFLQERIAFMCLRKQNSTDVAGWLPFLFPRVVGEVLTERRNSAIPTQSDDPEGADA